MVAITVEVQQSIHNDLAQGLTTEHARPISPYPRLRGTAVKMFHGTRGEARFRAVPIDLASFDFASRFHDAVASRTAAHANVELVPQALSLRS